MDSTTQVQIDLCAELAMLVALAMDTMSLGTMCLCNVGRFAGMVYADRVGKSRRASASDHGKCAIHGAIVRISAAR